MVTLIGIQRNIPLKEKIKHTLAVATTLIPFGRVAKFVAGASRIGAEAPLVARATTGAVGNVATKSTFLSKAGGIYERTLGNPLGAGGIKGFAGRVLGRGIGGVSLATGTAFTKSAITGEPVDITPRRLGYGALGFAFGGPVGSLAGIGLAGAQKVGEGIKGAGHFVDTHPIGPISPYGLGEGTRDLIGGIGSAISDFGSGLIGSNGPSASYGIGGFSPSVNVGGGTDYSALILALLGGGALGFGLGRRKRKKKKSKKSKRSRK